MIETNHHGTQILEVTNLSKSFGRRVICRKATFALSAGESLAIIGPNGSGKSTLVRMIAGLLRPDSGTIRHHRNGVVAKPEDWHRHVGMVSPELALYEELTALENMEFASQAGGWGRSTADCIDLLNELGLHGRGHDLVGAYSSGMKQRLKFATAFLKDPLILLLDEPTANLDEDGRERIWRSLADRNPALIIATNDPSEAARAQRRFRAGPDGGLVNHA